MDQSIFRTQQIASNHGLSHACIQRGSKHRQKKNSETNSIFTELEKRKCMINDAWKIEYPRKTKWLPFNTFRRVNVENDHQEFKRTGNINGCVRLCKS